MSARRIYIHHESPDAFVGAIEARLPDWETVCWRTDEEFVQGLPEAEVVLAYRPPRGHWAAASRLRLLQMSGAGIDKLLPAPDLSPEVRIANARGIHGAHMSEFALAMMLAFEKRLPTWLEHQQKREWVYHGMGSLAGKTLGILGLGAIGGDVARIGAALGLHVIGTQRTPKPVAGVQAVLPPERTAELLRQSDFLVVLLPLTDETRGLLDAEMLACLPRHAVLVNLARGGIVDEDALAAALRERRLRGAALDVFEREPLPRESPLWELPNAILTPHVSGWFPGYADGVAEILGENLARLASGEPLVNEVDPDRGY